ncbi:AAA family ATPase [Methylophaga sp.]|uniref:AAA family ATPase n=1 Tax=Methylophaga sp. TaxID=2024840 RepID=UPI00140170BE|nr:AAA family ATPase [Methylophaga sp.]MTI64397.1 AAA family ATPase [Methylophaga sp.]
MDDNFAQTIRKPVQTKPLFRLAPVSDLLKTPEPLEYLIRAHLLPESNVLLFGQPAIGKSIVCIDWAACIATGRDWHGYRVKQGAVVYIAGEGHHGISRRLKAWALANNAEADLKKAPLVVSERGAALNTSEELQNVIDAIDTVKSEYGDPNLIVIDTLHRNMQGDENSAQDMGNYFSAIDELRRLYKSTILTVHHSGHNESERSRGSSAIRAALDIEYSITQKNNLRSLVCTKMKDSAKPSPSQWELEVVSLPWLDIEGHPESSVVFNLSDNAPASNEQMTENVKTGMESFLTAADPASKGQLISVSLEDWRPCFYEIHKGNPEAKRRAFQRARNTLTYMKVMEEKNDVYTLNTSGTFPYSDMAELIDARIMARGNSGTYLKDDY